MLVPHSNCAADKGDLYAEYAAVRGDVAISQTDLLQITDTGGRQACTTFGVHPKLGVVQSLFNDGDAAFFANVVREPSNSSPTPRVAPLLLTICPREPPSVGKTHLTLA